VHRLRVWHYQSGVSLEGTKSLEACSFPAVGIVERAAAFSHTCLSTIHRSRSCSSAPSWRGGGLVSSLCQTLFVRYPPPLPLPCHDVFSCYFLPTTRNLFSLPANNLQPAIPTSSHLGSYSNYPCSLLRHHPSVEARSLHRMTG
jgi:hypothetical protein